ncbi:hypothetical protein B0T24DRAFT_685481 [Lasiosphaeria ovina]|uniref:Aminoglycoside phosphotransferase domain-containing protein n=1 Tax=Lasiosphaeria ovina TaxID=92902 RepID=A0AAE0JRR8_9PEZI|nr:hypothetical protein B0T24DRAFT_685481 [Lasiosphaeria ovina]
MAPPQVSFPIRVQNCDPPTQNELVARQNPKWLAWTVKEEKEAVGKEPPMRFVRPAWRQPPSVRDAKELLEYYAGMFRPLIPLAGGYRVSYFNEGATSVLFLINNIRIGDTSRYGKPGCMQLPSELLLRVTVPWAPYYGVENEVATTLYVSKLEIPVPKIYFFDSSGSNPLGLDLILLERIPGTTAEDLLQKLQNPQGPYRGKNFDANEVERGLASEAVGYLSEDLWDASKTFTHFGSLYRDWGHAKNFFVGPLIDHLLFAPTVGGICIDRGPYPDWLSMFEGAFEYRMGLDWDKIRAAAPHDHHGQPKAAADGRKTGAKPAETEKRIRALYLRTQKELAALAAGNDGEAAALKPRMTHGDCHGGNVIVSPPPDSQIQAIIDWESASILPACMFPRRPDIAAGHGFEALPETKTQASTTFGYCWSALYTIID